MKPELKLTHDDCAPDDLTQILDAWGHDRHSRPRLDRYWADTILRMLTFEKHPDPVAMLCGKIRAYQSSQAGRSGYRVALRTFLSEEMWRLPDEAWNDEEVAPSSPEARRAALVAEYEAATGRTSHTDAELMEYARTRNRGA